jgi:hypothetical protein
MRSNLNNRELKRRQFSLELPGKPDRCRIDHTCLKLKVFRLD